MSTPTPLRGYQDPYETWSEKAKRKFNENPWVPIGCLATCGALVMSAVKMRQGHSKHMNYWMRARVALQGVTLVVLVAGSAAIQKKRAAAAAEGAVLDGADAEFAQQKRVQAKEEFEERLRAAEHVTEMEESAGLTGVKTVKGPTVNREEEHRRQERQSQQPPPTPPGATSAAVKQSSSWKWWSSTGSDKGSGTS